MSSTGTWILSPLSRTHSHELLKDWFLLDSAVPGVRPLRLLNVTPSHTHTHLYMDLSSTAVWWIRMWGGFIHWCLFSFYREDFIVLGCIMRFPHGGEILSGMILNWTFVHIIQEYIRLYMKRLIPEHETDSLWCIELKRERRNLWAWIILHEHH